MVTCPIQCGVLYLLHIKGSSTQLHWCVCRCMLKAHFIKELYCLNQNRYSWLLDVIIGEICKKCSFWKNKNTKNLNFALAIKTRIHNFAYQRVDMYIKAILQVLIYKALYDKSYLGSKTTMTSGEWTCLISFATAPLTCSERGGSEKFKMKIYVSSGIRTHTPASPRQESCSALDRSATLVRYKVEHYSLTVFWNGYVTIPVWNRLWFDTQCKVL